MTRSTIDTGICRTLPDDSAPPTHGLVVCKGCRKWVDPSVCHCGESIGSDNRAHGNHSPIPMGCDCYRAAP